MTRPIKFRAWDKNRQEYVYEWKDGSAISAWFWQKHSDEEARFVFEQVTGLTDKNGKEIYEGDIIRVIEDKYNGNLDGDEFEVKFEGGMFMPFGWKDEGDLVVEVIGNKCENPELLEAK